MASKNYALQTAGWSQSDQRAYATFYDQHKSVKFPQGRPWWAVVERSAEGAATPMPVGELQPNGWSAPWYPAPSYMTASVGKAVPGSSLQEHRFRIDYTSMTADRQRAMREYYDRAVLEAIGQGWPAPDYGEAITYRLRAIVGPPPLSPKIPEAAMAEDPWILGFSDQENEELARLLASGVTDILTAAQSEAKVDKVKDLQDQLEATNAMVQKLLARGMEQDAEADANKAKMAKARAGRKPSQTVAV